MKQLRLYIVVLFSLLLLFSCGKEEVKVHFGEDLSATVSGVADDYEYVDLGLSVQWATCNVGASQPTGYGELYAWGETTPKSDYTWKNYRWSLGTYETLIKYCAADGQRVLLADDDAATVNMGGEWRTPTVAELIELVEGCEWHWTENFGGLGAIGQVGISKINGNVIFLPAAGFGEGASITDRGVYGGYWSSTTDLENAYNAHYYNFYDRSLNRFNNYRCHGRSVRAVR